MFAASGASIVLGAVACVRASPGVSLRRSDYSRPRWHGRPRAASVPSIRDAEIEAQADVGPCCQCGRTTDSGVSCAWFSTWVPGESEDDEPEDESPSRTWFPGRRGPAF